MNAERTLRAAATLAAAEAVVLATIVVARGNRSTPAILVALEAKLLFCRGVVARRPGAFLALVLYESVTVLFAIAAPGIASAGRVLAAATAVTVLALLGRSARLFPSLPVPRA